MKGFGYVSVCNEEVLSQASEKEKEEGGKSRKEKDREAISREGRGRMLFCFFGRRGDEKVKHTPVDGASKTEGEGKKGKEKEEGRGRELGDYTPVLSQQPANSS